VVDVFPDELTLQGPQPGYWNVATRGLLKGTHRNGHWRPEPIPVNEEVTYDIDMEPVSYLFKAGHRVAIQVESADAAHSLPNTNPAVNTVFHTSELVLPIIPR
jgi:hypothetical protein